jgi:hypothetical protein
VHSRSVVKISYNIKMITHKIRSHDDRRSATWICSSFSNNDILYCSKLHKAFTVFQTKVHLKLSITLSMMKSRKDKVVLQYISPQMSR